MLVLHLTFFFTLLEFRKRRIAGERDPSPRCLGLTSRENASEPEGWSPCKATSELLPRASGKSCAMQYPYLLRSTNSCERYYLSFFLSPSAGAAPGGIMRRPLHLFLDRSQSLLHWSYFPPGAAPAEGERWKHQVDWAKEQGSEHITLGLLYTCCCSVPPTPEAHIPRLYPKHSVECRPKSQVHMGKSSAKSLCEGHLQSRH